MIFCFDIYPRILFSRFASEGHCFDGIIAKGSKNAIRSLITLEITKPSFNEPLLFRLPSEPEAMFPFYHFFKGPHSRHVPTLCQGAKSRDRKKHPNWYRFRVNVALFHPPSRRSAVFVCAPAFYINLSNNHKLYSLQNWYNIIIDCAIL